MNLRYFYSLNNRISSQDMSIYLYNLKLLPIGHKTVFDIKSTKYPFLAFQGWVNT
jgi:hypothetical protein